jgi:hypothetical protein
MLPRAALDCLYRLFHLMTISMKGDGLNNNSPNVESFIELCLYDCAHTSKNITQIQHEKLMKPLSFVENELAGQLPTRLAEEFADKLVYL